ncbi:MAG: TetR/AcrR family transcriptional regulator [Henriciella sp.]
MATEKRESRAFRTRSALIAAGVDLIADRPLEAIPIDDLVSTAGVGKGSFFNHFRDKSGFSEAIALEIRAEIETRIGTANHGVSDPLKRFAGGMQSLTDYALTHRKETIALLRTSVGFTSRDHPLNEGVRADIDACITAGLMRKEAARTGVMFWIGLSSAMVANVLEDELSRQRASEKLEQILLFGLIGLGAPEDKAAKVAEDAAYALRHNQPEHKDPNSEKPSI